MRHSLVVFALLAAGIAACFAIAASDDGPAKSAPASTADKKPAASGGQTASATAPPQQSEEEQAIRASADLFVKVYNSHDAKAVAELFTPEAEFIDEGGNLVKGRKAIEQDFAKFFKDNPKATIHLDIHEIHILTPNIAIEEGFVHAVPVPDGFENITSYVTLHTKQDGKWKVASVRDYEVADEDVSPHERLLPLAWLLGDWIEEGPDSVVTTSCKWSENGNYLLEKLDVFVAGRSALKADARIGWDPVTRQIKWWLFDSEGGYAEGFWIPKEDEWIVKSQGVDHDGRQLFSTSVFRIVDDDTMAWRSYDRIVDGELTPDVNEIVIKRKPPSAMP